MNIGFMLALQILGIYLILGPLVVLGLYIFLDCLVDSEKHSKKLDSTLALPMDLWTTENIQKYFGNRKNIDKL